MSTSAVQGVQHTEARRELDTDAQLRQGLAEEDGLRVTEVKFHT